MKYLLLLILIISSNSFSSVAIPDRDTDGNIINTTSPFSSKGAYSFRGTGKKCSLAANAMTVCEFEITYAHVKLNGVEILGADVGDKADIKILDTATGTYTLAQTGTAVPNAILNQFGFSWSLSDKSTVLLPYVADLYVGMRIVADITNSGAAQDVCLNYYIHEE